MSWAENRRQSAENKTAPPVFFSVPDGNGVVNRTGLMLLCGTVEVEQPFKLALVQMLIEGGRKEANLRRALERIAQAAASHAQVVVLPEALTLGWTHPSSRTGAEEIPEGQSCRMLGDAARRHGVYVCAGLVERAGNKVFNSAVLIEPGGNVILHHRK